MASVLPVSGNVFSNYIVDIFPSSDIFLCDYIDKCSSFYSTVVYSQTGNVAHKVQSHPGNFGEGGDIRLCPLAPPPPSRVN